MLVIEMQQTKAATWATHHPCLMMINSRTVLAFNQWLKIRRSAGCVNLRKAAKRIKEDLLTPDGLMLSLECSASQKHQTNRRHKGYHLNSFTSMVRVV